MAKTIKGSYNHSIRYVGCGGFRVSWVVDSSSAGSRIRNPVTRTRDVELDGARRFAKKWDCEMPVVKDQWVDTGDSHAA